MSGRLASWRLVSDQSECSCDSDHSRSALLVHRSSALLCSALRRPFGLSPAWLGRLPPQAASARSYTQAHRSSEQTTNERSAPAVRSAADAIALPLICPGPPSRPPAESCAFTWRYHLVLIGRTRCTPQDRRKSRTSLRKKARSPRSPVRSSQCASASSCAPPCRFALSRSPW